MRIAIVGAGGGVGSSVAFNLLLRDEAYAVDLVDGRSGMAVSHEMDLQQVLALGASGTSRVVELGGIVEADVVVVSAAAPLTVNRSRLVYLRDNVEILATVADVLGPDWPGVLLLVTNPVDVLATWLVTRRGFDRRRVLGYTANDSLRLQTAIGTLRGVPAASVDAWVLGEHGDACVPLFDRVTIDGAPARLDERERREAEEFVRGWYVRHVALDSGRSSTWTTGLGVARMIAATSTWPASLVLDGEYGIHGAAVTVPVRLPGASVEEWALAPPELEALRAAADAVRAAAATIDA